MQDVIESKKINELFRADIPLFGRVVSYSLHIPCAEEVLYLIDAPEGDTEELTRLKLETELRSILRHRDGECLNAEEIDAIMNDQWAFAVAIGARNRLYETLLEYGQLILRCPQCGADQPPISLAVLTTALHAGPWPVLEPNRIVLSPPALSAPPCRGQRPIYPPCAGRIGFCLPTAVLGLPNRLEGGALMKIGFEEECAARRKYEVDESDAPPGREDWLYSVLGFRAILRLSVALKELQGESVLSTPELVESIPIVDYFFLDCLYWLTYEVDIKNESSPNVKCERCGVIFLPVA